jgi:hypothetical protein
MIIVSESCASAMLHDPILQVHAQRVVDHPQDGIELLRRQVPWQGPA